jgi:hypothetical protein
LASRIKEFPPEMHDSLRDKLKPSMGDWINKAYLLPTVPAHLQDRQTHSHSPANTPSERTEPEMHNAGHAIERDLLSQVKNNLKIGTMPFRRGAAPVAASSAQEMIWSATTNKQKQNIWEVEENPPLQNMMGKSRALIVIGDADADQTYKRKDISKKQKAAGQTRGRTLNK